LRGGLQECNDIVIISWYHWCMLKSHFAALLFTEGGAIKNQNQM
jgi:hypothetical protein